MNAIEKKLDRLLRRIAWKMTNIKKSKKKDYKEEVIDEIDKRIKLQDSVRERMYESDNKSTEYTITFHLDEEVLSKISKIQELIQTKKQIKLTEEEVISFLLNAMNYGRFQMWLLENKLNGVELSINDKLKKFLSETSEEKILILYDIDQELNDTKNIVEKKEKGKVLSKKIEKIK